MIFCYNRGYKKGIAMSFESDLFKKKRVRFETLSAFGFVKIGQDYLYKEIFMAGGF